MHLHINLNYSLVVLGKTPSFHFRMKVLFLGEKQLKPEISLLLNFIN